MEAREERNYFALFLLIIPLLTIFGNLLVVLSVMRERSLRSITNYFIFSLAVADFFVALCVMPFAVYVEVERMEWNLGGDACNLYIALDVCASTASIFNLMAISIDRYWAIARPIEYSRSVHKNRRRAWITIFLIWFLSAVIALPIVLGVNDSTANEIGVTKNSTNETTSSITIISHSCEFNSPLYMIGSSLGSFYIPCLVMVVLYSFILQRLQERRRTLKKKRAKPSDVNYVSKDGHLLPNRPANNNNNNVGKKETKSPEKLGLHHALNLLGAAKLATDIGKRLEASAEETTMNTSTTHSVSSDDDDLPSSIQIPQTSQLPEIVIKPQAARSTSWGEPLLQYAHSYPSLRNPYWDDVHDDNATVYTARLVESCTTLPAFGEDLESIPFIDVSRPGSMKYSDLTGAKPCDTLTHSIKALTRGRVQSTINPGRSVSAKKTNSLSNPRIVLSSRSISDVMEENESRIVTPLPDLHSITAFGFNCCARFMTRMKCSRGSKLKSRMGHTTKRLIKREQKHLRKETKATQTLAVVLAVFLICWAPFFTVQLWNSLCMVLRDDTLSETKECLDFLYFFLTTWLGYMNSFMNPIIYTIFNPEYRKAFRRILTCQKPRR